MFSLLVESRGCHFSWYNDFLWEQTNHEEVVYFVCHPLKLNEFKQIYKVQKTITFKRRQLRLYRRYLVCKFRSHVRMLHKAVFQKQLNELTCHRKPNSLSQPFHISMYMMTSSNGKFFHVTGLLFGQFPSQRPVTRTIGVYFDLRLE